MTSMRDNAWRPLRRWEKVLVATVGVLVLTWAGMQAWQTLSLLTRGQRAHGVIVENSGHPLIRFTTAGGATIRFVQNGGATGDPGSAMAVVYDPRDPAGTAHADTFFALWGDVLGALPMGLGCLAVVLLGGEIRRTGRYG